MEIVSFSISLFYKKSFFYFIFTFIIFELFYFSQKFIFHNTYSFLVVFY